MSTLVPSITPRAQDRILDRLVGCVRGYVPEWHPDADSAQAGRAVLRVFARYQELLENGLDQVPERSRLAFLDMLGIGLLPAQGARAPLVFSLIDNSPIDVTLPARSEVAAQLAPPLVAPSPNSVAASSAPQTLIFSTEKTITLSRAQLKTVYSVLPGSDEFTDHTARLTQGFSFFDQAQRCLHAIYLGHDELFALAGRIAVIVSVTLASGRAKSEDDSQSSAPRPALKTGWEYFTDQGWLPLTLEPEDDTTDGWRKDGQMVIRRECGPNAKQETFEGRTSYWIRGRLSDPLLPDGTDGQRTIPIVDDLRVRVAIDKKGLAPEAAFADSVPLDVSKEFFPFGEQPTLHPTFYLGSKEVFQRKGAQIQIALTLSQVGKPAAMKLDWEFYDGTAWAPLGINPQDYQFTTTTGAISFLCPRSWAETTVNGEKNYWLRVRVASGDFGFPLRLDAPPTRQIKKVSKDDRKVLILDTNNGYTGGESVVLKKSGLTRAAKIVERRINNQIVLESALAAAEDYTDGTIGAVPPPPNTTLALLTATLQPPVISTLTLGYTYTTDPTVLDHCLIENDFVFADETEACRWPDRSFMPFHPVADQRPTVHFGFDQSLPAGLMSLYLDVPQLVVGEVPETGASPFIWEYRAARGWLELGVLDETLGFRRSGMVQFIGPPDALTTAGLGGDLIRIRARLKPGERFTPLLVRGAWLNAVWAEQSVAIDQEPLGITDGNPDQTLTVQHRPVREGERVEVQEWTGRGERWRLDVDDVEESMLRFDYNPATKEVSAVWVAWQDQATFLWSQLDRSRLRHRSRQRDCSFRRRRSWHDAAGGSAGAYFLSQRRSDQRRHARHGTSRCDKGTAHGGAFCC